MPLVGHTFEFGRDRDALFRRGYREHGDAFTIHLMGKPIAVISGAANNKLFFGETDKALSMNEGYQNLQAAFGEVLFIAGPDAYQNQRPIIQSLFRHEKMAGYVNAMRAETQRWLDSLDDQDEVNISRDLMTLAQSIAGHAFIGEHFREEIGEGFWADYDAIAASIDFLLPPSLPLPRNLRRERAKGRMRELFSQMIARRRANPDQYDDMVAHVMNTPQKDGSFMGNDEIARLFIALLFAGHETTAGQATWTIIELLRNPDYLARVQAEIAEHVTPGMDARGLSRLSYTYAAIDETTRLHPSADVLLRVAKSPLVFGEYTVPEGWAIMVNAANSHGEAGGYSAPERWDPLRQSDGREEGSPFDIMGFGGGVHKCTGMNFAKNEMAVIIMTLFSQFEVELLTQDVHVVMGKGANRVSDTFIKVRRKSAEVSNIALATDAGSAVGAVGD
jgi:sterol 14-demethylase